MWNGQCLHQRQPHRLFLPAGPSPHGVLGRFAPRAGVGSTDVYGWGYMRSCILPTILQRQPGSLTTINMQERSYQPFPLFLQPGEEIFSPDGAGDGHHRSFGPWRSDPNRFSPAHPLHKPMGWGHQFRNDVLLNINVNAEKQLFSAGRWLTLIGGARAYAGTMVNGAALYQTLLIGKMDPGSTDSHALHESRRGPARAEEMAGLFSLPTRVAIFRTKCDAAGRPVHA